METFTYQVNKGCGRYGGVVMAESEAKALEQITKAYKKYREKITKSCIEIHKAADDILTAELYKEYGVIESY